MIVKTCCDHAYDEGRYDTLAEIAAYCDAHAVDGVWARGHVARTAWANAMRDVARHCRMLAGEVAS